MAGVDEAIRVRYAPSPTGALHLGGARTALFNYLFARQKHGQFLLRIEDTDRARFKPDSQASIEEGLHWLGMNWDEPAMIQSQRKEIYAEAASVLLELGAAYRCFCTPQRLEQMRAEQRARHEPERYDRRCRSIPRAESDRRAAGGERFVVRQAIPIDGTTTFHDLVMGTVTFRNDTLDDHVLLKSDGFPTYHLAFAVDDHAMAISHIIRGEGWLPSAPKHLISVSDDPFRPRRLGAEISDASGNDSRSRNFETAPNGALLCLRRGSVARIAGHAASGRDHEWQRTVLHHGRDRGRLKPGEEQGD